MPFDRVADPDALASRRYDGSDERSVVMLELTTLHLTVEDGNYPLIVATNPTDSGNMSDDQDIL